MPYVPWKSITAVWKSASQIWSQAWFEGGPTPPTPTEDTGVYTAGALDPRFQTPWLNWVENQKRKKYKRKIELACVINGIEFREEKESAEEVVIGFKVDRVELTESTQLSEVQLNEVRVQMINQ